MNGGKGILMKYINPNCLTIAKDWESPTIQEVDIIYNEIYEKLNISGDFKQDELSKHIPVKPRALRAWKGRKSDNPETKSIIKYGAWSLLVAIARNQLIFSDPINIDISKIPSELIRPLRYYQTPDVSIAKKLVGEYSITGLTRKQVAQIFRYSPTHIGRLVLNLPFELNALILLYCGVCIDDLFYSDSVANKRIYIIDCSDVESKKVIGTLAKNETIDKSHLLESNIINQDKYICVETDKFFHINDVVNVIDIDGQLFIENQL